MDLSGRDRGTYLFNPIIVDSVMYVLAKNSAVVALDAATGKEIWIHENRARQISTPGSTTGKARTAKIAGSYSPRTSNLQRSTPDRQVDPRSAKNGLVESGEGPRTAIPRRSRVQSNMPAACSRT